MPATNRTVQSQRHQPGRIRRKEMDIAEHEMPGLMSTRKKYAAKQPSRAPASPAACT